MKKAAFIGTGNMGGLLAGGAVAVLGPDQVLLSNRTAAKAQALAETLGCTVCADNKEAAAGAEYLFLGVKPHLMAGVLKELVPVLAECHARGEDKVLVSMAAGLQIRDMQTHLEGVGYEVPLLRIMPNTCVAVGAGLTALCAGPGTDESFTAEVERILSKTGQVVRIEESHMDAFSAVAGCGPAFIFPYLEGMADGGVMCGLSRRDAQAYAALTMIGAARLVLETGKHPGELKDAVCSPGGSTIAGVAELEHHGMRAAILDAVVAAWKRNAQLGK